MLAAAVLVFMVGGGAYALLSHYFQTSTDQALRLKVALEYGKLGLTVPADLQSAYRTRQTHPNPTQTPIPAKPENEDNTESEKNAPASASESGDDTYDSELASIFILPVDAQGKLISNPNAYTVSFSPDAPAIAAALARGSDFRTVHQVDGTRIRLFTYRVSTKGNLSVLQVGRSLQDQDHLLRQMLIGLIILGGLSMLAVGVACWWLAGHSLDPAQQAWDRQQTFVANASHELRTPLTLLRASAEVARRGLQDQDAKYELLGDILSETDHMSRLVDDLLLLSRLDTDRLHLERQPVAAEAFLNDLVREMGRVAAGRGVTLDVLQAQGSILADPARLRQVLLIMLDNALRHTPSGGAIHIAAFLVGRQTKWQVSDTGSGISAKHLPYIFERFYRGEADRDQAGSGSGLGLAIAKGLVEAMHGHITVASLPGQGTQVTLTFPVSNV